MQAVLPKSLSLNKLKTGASDDVPAWVPETCLAEVAFQVTDSRKLQRKTAQRREQKKKSWCLHQVLLPKHVLLT